MKEFFDFEQPIEEVEKKILQLNSENPQDQIKIENHKKEVLNLYKKIYTNLTSWQKVQIARHPDRPHTSDYIENICNEFIPLAGDKKFAEDRAIIGGLAKIENFSVMIIGTEKGNTMESRLKHNFGMAKPEGYRKIQRLYYLAEKINIPIITLIDTAGAYPGKEAEERGQSESIAKSIAVSLNVKTPILSIIIGEGGSGGAVALATGDYIMMLENSIYSVISPEGCASILWRDSDSVKKAADSLKLTSQECIKLKVIDDIIPENHGGAHRYKKEQYSLVKEYILKKIIDLKKISLENLLKARNEKFLNITK